MKYALILSLLLTSQIPSAFAQNNSGERGGDKWISKDESVNCEDNYLVTHTRAVLACTVDTCNADQICVDYYLDFNSGNYIVVSKGK